MVNFWVSCRLICNNVKFPRKITDVLRILLVNFYQMCDLFVDVFQVGDMVINLPRNIS